MSGPTLALTIEIDRQHQLPLYLQICERFRAAIAAGHLRPGDRVPALRGLATQLNTARGTVEQAYTIRSTRAICRCAARQARSSRRPCRSR